jgi:hypothetical protein
VYERPPGSSFIVKLYKLHGSLDWRHENDAVQEVAADEYVGRNVVIYPVRKPVMDEPFKTLFELFERRLDESQVCVVIGSSLRDEHLRQALVKRINAGTLRAVLVGGSTEEQSEMEEKIKLAAADALLSRG